MNEVLKKYATAESSKHSALEDHLQPLPKSIQPAPKTVLPEEPKDEVEGFGQDENFEF